VNEVVFGDSRFIGPEFEYVTVREAKFIGKIYNELMKGINDSVMVVDLIGDGFVDGLLGENGGRTYMWESVIHLTGRDFYKPITDLNDAILKSVHDFAHAIDGWCMNKMLVLDLDTIKKKDVTKWAKGDEFSVVLSGKHIDEKWNNAKSRFVISHMTYKKPKLEGVPDRNEKELFDPDSKRVLVKKGFCAFLQKPMTVEVVRNVVRDSYDLYFRKYFGIDILDESKAVFVE